jgi:hypothetical protein
MGDKYCANCKQYVKPIRNYKNIYGRQGIGTFLLGKLRPERCPICHSTNLLRINIKEEPTPEPIQVKETIIKEVVMIPCDHCKQLMPQISLFCPNCGAPKRG